MHRDWLAKEQESSAPVCIQCFALFCLVSSVGSIVVVCFCCTSCDRHHCRSAIPYTYRVLVRRFYDTHQ